MKRKGNKSHGLFFTLIKQIAGYKDAYRDVIKEGLVMQYSDNRTSSLSEMYTRYPAEYCRMIEELKHNAAAKDKLRNDEADKARKRVIAVISAWLDKMGYKFEGKDHRMSFIKRVACRAASCNDFNLIPLSRLTAIYSLFRRKNEVDIASVLVDVPLCLN